MSGQLVPLPSVSVLPALIAGNWSTGERIPTNSARSCLEENCVDDGGSVLLKLVEWPDIVRHEDHKLIGNTTPYFGFLL